MITIPIVLRFTNVSKSFGPLLAVDGLSLSIRRGEIFGLLGPNGAGKTTIMSMAVGLLTPTSGTVELEELGPPTNTPTRLVIGIAPQSLALYAELSGEENVTFFGRLYGLSGRRLRERVDWSLEFVGLSDRRRDRCRIYSEGMKRRLNLAVALVHEPRLLLLDEPTANIDPHSRHMIHERTRLLRDSGCTVVYTTHYLEEAEGLCDRVGILDRGRLVALDTVESLIAKHGDPSSEHGEDLTLREREPMSIADGGTPGIQVRPRQTIQSLEQVFLNLTGRQLRD